MTAPEIPFLRGLPPEAAAAVRQRMISVSIGGGRSVFEQGEEADALYTLVSGSVGISARDLRTGMVRKITLLRPPETVGEMSVLTSMTHSATATALRDSHLLVLDREDLHELVDAHPVILRYFTNHLAERLRMSNEGAVLDNRPRTFAILSVTAGPSPIEFGRLLARAFDEALPGETGCLTDWPQGADDEWFHRFEAAHARTIFVASRVDCPWCQLCLRHADQVLLLAEPDEPLLPGAREYLERVDSPWIGRDVVVNQPSNASVPRALHPEVSALAAMMRIQVRKGHAGDHRRLARLVSGSARGLVLGGGGARGFAHYGVIRALADADLPIDFIGGTSMGAIVAACVAMDWDMDRIAAEMERGFVNQNPVDDYTLPYIALTRGAKVDAALALSFGDTRIEDLWLPFFCMSSNLTTGMAMVHKSGALHEALRASIAIPGLLPPVCSADGVLVDGGMMNNLPADVMAEQERGPVLAVDVGNDVALTAMDPRSWFGKAMRRWVGAPAMMPAMTQVLLRAATVSGAAQTMNAVRRASVVLRPPLAGVDLRAWSSFHATAALGYGEARDAIEDGRLASWIDPAASVMERIEGMPLGASTDALPVN
ncbi:MAG: patatin-like phospholipase family protein [Hansschlegelia sp.]